MIFSVPALLALAGVALLALAPFPDASSLAGPQMGPDRATLWFLFACALLLWIPTVFARLKASRDASTWALLSVFFVLFHIADRAGPSEGWALTFSFLPDDPIPLSYAARVVVVGALCSFPLWLRRGGPEKAIVAALVLVAAFGVGSLWFLGHYYPINPDELSPRPTVTLLLQSLTYACLALCCRAATEGERTRGFVLKTLSIVLFLVAARHQFSPIAPPKDDQ